MPLFSRSVDIDTPLKKNDTVRATEPLRGVPEGTTGKVKLVNGLDWLRYWVFFDNGVQLGSIDSEQLVRPEHWDEFHTRREARRKAEAEAEARAEAGAAAEAEAGAATTTAADPNDPLAALKAMVPAHLLERSAAARARLLGS